MFIDNKIPNSLSSQLRFLIETERLKGVLRKTLPIGLARRENSSEHSWSLALMAVVFAEYANEEIDLLKVLLMVLLHDLVEIDAGDMLFYKRRSSSKTQQSEHMAAQRIFGILPAAQGNMFELIWQEFEVNATPEAHFAHAIDRLLPILQNLNNEGGSWKKYMISVEQVIENNNLIARGSELLWEFAKRMIHKGEKQGCFSSIEHPKG